MFSDDNARVPGAPEDGTTDTPLTLRGSQRLRAIPTLYSGCEFRSRLEARWAKFFNELAIEWRYEYEGWEGFILAPFGERYLPDFYLPELGYWIEVKGAEPDEDALRKPYLFNYSFAHDADPAKHNQRVFVVHGDIPWPYPQEGNIVGFSASHAPGNKHRWDLVWQICPLCQQLLIGKIGHMCCSGCEEEFGMLLHDALDVVEGIPEFDKVIDIVPAMVAGAMRTEFFGSGHKAPELQEAYGKARSARFEFDDREQRRSA